MEVNRKIIRQLNISEDLDDGYIDSDKTRLISMMWEITKDAWSFVEGQDAEQRLQRDAATFIAGRS